MDKLHPTIYDRMISGELGLASYLLLGVIGWLTLCLICCGQYLVWSRSWRDNGKV